MINKNPNWKKSIRNKAVKTIDKSRNIWKNKFYDIQEELRKANIQISLYKDLWQQAEKSVSELKDENWKLKQQLNRPKTEGCGRMFNDFIFGERICGRFEDLKHSDHMILCPDCKKENSK